MATITLDAKTRVTWVPASSGIANKSAPTTAELAAGIDLQDQITPDGLQVTPSTGSIDNSNLGSTFTTNEVGRRSFQSSVKLQRQSATADATSAALVYGSEGFLVIRRGVAKATAYATSQRVQVYPAVCGEQSVPQSGPEQIWTYEVPMMITDDPVTVPEATIA